MSGDPNEASLKAALHFIRFCRCPEPGLSLDHHPEQKGSVRQTTMAKPRNTLSGDSLRQA
jgi:hypothetical protein